MTKLQTLEAFKADMPDRKAARAIDRTLDALAAAAGCLVAEDAPVEAAWREFRAAAAGLGIDAVPADFDGSTGRYGMGLRRASARPAVERLAEAAGCLAYRRRIRAAFGMPAFSFEA